MAEARLTREELDFVAQTMRLAAREVILPSFGCLGEGAIRCKSGPLDLVTDADEAAERLITRTLLERFPDARVIGEEGVAARPDLLDSLGAPGRTFVIDPIDGTANYAAGLPLFGVMVAVVESGVTVGGAILDPLTGRMAMAMLGQGAWEVDARGEETALRVAEPVPLSGMTGAASWRYLSPERRRGVPEALCALGGVWDYRCAAHQYLMLARGSCHFLLFGRTQPWDHLAGLLIHAEAGGHAAGLGGATYGIGLADDGLLCAPDAESWHALHAALFGSPNPD